MPKNLFLVRHGQSEGNLVRKKFEESGDEAFFSDEFLGLHESQYALTDLGVEQATKAGKWFSENNFTIFDRMLVSNNVRAMQTAAHLEIDDANWLVDFNLRERDGGLFDVIVPPQGESIADVCTRIKIVLDTLARECDGKNVIIVCHGHVIRAFKIILEKMSLQKSNEFLLPKEDWARVPNCSILHYTRQDPSDNTKNISDRFGWVRMIRPAGGGNPEDEFSLIKRRSYSNKDLLSEAINNRGA